MPPTDVIVIGAGAAGLAATEALVSLGKTVTCIEAGNRIGGRAYTDTETFGVPFDRGAHWLHNGAINAFIDKGKALGLDLYPAPNHTLTAGDDPEGTAIWAEVDAISDAMRREAEAGRDVALSSLFKPLTEWSFTAAMMHILPMGRNLHEISTKGFRRLRRKPRLVLPARLRHPRRPERRRHPRHPEHPRRACHHDHRRGRSPYKQGHPNRPRRHRHRLPRHPRRRRHPLRTGPRHRAPRRHRGHQSRRLQPRRSAIPARSASGTARHLGHLPDRSARRRHPPWRRRSLQHLRNRPLRL